METNNSKAFTFAGVVLWRYGYTSGLLKIRGINAEKIVDHISKKTKPGFNTRLCS